MTRDNCIECEEEKHVSECFSIKIFNQTVQWCFDCANKQLSIEDLKIKKMSKKEQEYKKVCFKNRYGEKISFKVRKGK